MDSGLGCGPNYSFSGAGLKVHLVEAKRRRLSKTVDGLKHQVKYWKARARRFAEKLRVATRPQDAFKRGPALRYCSTHGGFGLAARRAASNGNACALGLAVGCDISGRTIQRYEILLRACLIASFISFQEASREALASFGGLRLAVHVIRADATNASIWQAAKLFVSEASSCYAYDPITNHTDFENLHLERRRILSRLQIYQTGTALGAMGMLERQFAQIGLPTLVKRAKSGTHHPGGRPVVCYQTSPSITM